MGQTTVLGRIVATDGSLATCRIDPGILGESRLGSIKDPAGASVGAIVRVMVAGTPVFANLIEFIDGDSSEFVLGRIEYLGEASRDAAGMVCGFRRGINAYPQPGDEIQFASECDLKQIFAPPDVPHVSIGTVYPSAAIGAPILVDSLLGRHFAVVGSSGAGKSTTVALILDRIIGKTGRGHVLILDPHGEYATAFGGMAKVWDVGNLRLPYWAMNHVEHCEVFVSGSPDERTVGANILSQCLLKARQRNLHVVPGQRLTADTPISYQLNDLLEEIDEEAGRLEKLADAQRYTRMRLTIAQFFNDSRYGFIFNASHAAASIEDLLGELLRIPGHGMPISIVDLAGVPSEIVNVVVSTLARLVLDFAISTPRDRSVPVLLVCEEAHRYLPRVGSPATAAVERQLERIAREGRKYGVCLGLVSQRPSELSETALSQCGTILAMRLNNRNDQEHLAAALSESARSMAGSLATLRDRECIISGEGVPVPMRVMVDALEPGKRPASDDPAFCARWSAESADAELLAEVVGRWREAR